MTKLKQLTKEIPYPSGNAKQRRKVIRLLKKQWCNIQIKHCGNPRFKYFVCTLPKTELDNHE